MRFSIIIPTYGRPDRLHQCLSGLAALDYPRNEFEIMVVDDGSPESVQAVACSFSNRLNVNYLRQENAGPASARNLGARCSRGQILAFLDDDCVPRPDWLRQLEAEASRRPEALLGGTTRNACPGNPFAETNQILIDAIVAWFRDRDSQLQFFPSNNVAMCAAAFHEVGGFDASMRLVAGEDREFCARWLASGRRLARATAACIDHYHPQKLSSFLEMHFRYGQGAAMLHCRRQTSPVQFAKRGLYLDLLRTAWRVTKTTSRVEVAILLMLSQVAGAFGYFFNRMSPAIARRSA
jgi:glycosyltransferase involved in cell wall biosynthesis